MQTLQGAPIDTILSLDYNGNGVLKRSTPATVRLFASSRQRSNIFTLFFSKYSTVRLIVGSLDFLGQTVRGRAISTSGEGYKAPSGDC